MKKLLLGLGSIASVVAPVAAVISCGDSDNKDTGTHSQAMPIENTDLTGLKQSLTDAIALQGSAVASATMVSNYAWSVGGESGTALSAIKLTFSAATSFNPDGTSTSIAANETVTIVSGQTEDDAESGIRIIVSNADAGTDMLYTPSAAKKTKLKTMILGLMGSHGGDHHTDGGNGQTGMPGADSFHMMQPIDAQNQASLIVNVNTIVTHLTDAQLHNMVAVIAADPKGADATYIMVTMMKVDMADPQHPVTKYFAAPIAAGKATDFNAVKTAFASVAAADSMPLPPAPGAGGNTGGGSGSTGGTVDKTAQQIADESFSGTTMTSTKTRTEVKALIAGSAAVTFADLGITPSDATATYTLTKPNSGSMWSVSIAKGGATATGNFTLGYADTTQDEIDAVVTGLAATFTAQTSTMSEASIKAAITKHTGAWTTLQELGVSVDMNFPTNMEWSDYSISYAPATTAWNNGVLTMVLTIAGKEGSATKDVNVVITSTAPVDAATLFGDTTKFPATVDTAANITTKVNAVVRAVGSDAYIAISTGSAKAWTATTVLTAAEVNGVLGTTLPQSFDVDGNNFMVEYTMDPITGPLWTHTGGSWSRVATGDGGGDVTIAAGQFTVHAKIVSSDVEVSNPTKDLTFTAA